MRYGMGYGFGTSWEEILSEYDQSTVHRKLLVTYQEMPITTASL